MTQIKPEDFNNEMYDVYDLDDEDSSEAVEAYALSREPETI